MLYYDGEELARIVEKVLSLQVMFLDTEKKVLSTCSSPYNV